MKYTPALIPVKPLSLWIFIIGFGMWTPPTAAHAATLYWVGGDGVDIQAGYTDTIHET